MSTKRFSTTGFSIYGIAYEVNIYEHGASYGSPGVLDLGPNIKFNLHGNDRDVLESIITASATISIFLNSVAAETFFDDLLTTSEGTFYLELKWGSVRLFMGRILGNGLKVEDRLQPFVTIEAIDGLTQLKGKQYTHPGVGYQKLIDIFVHCLNQVDVVDKFFTTSQQTVSFMSGLAVNTSMFTGGGNIEEVLRYENYFYKFENDIKDTLTYWDVLEEMLNRHCLKLTYLFGNYLIVGKDVVIQSPGKYRIYGKDKSKLIDTTYTIPVMNISDGADSDLLAGGTFFFEPGIKSMTIETDKYHTLKNLADGIVWTRADTTYKNMGLMLAGVQYATHMRFSIQNQFTPTQASEFNFIKVKFFFRAKEWNGADLKYPKLSFTPSNITASHFEMINPTLPTQELVTDPSETAIIVVFRYSPPMDYIFHFIFEDYDIDREMQFRVEFVEFLDISDFTPLVVSPTFGGLFDFKIKHEFGQYPVLKADVVKFYGETDSDETETKTLQIFAPDTYGSLLSKGVIWNGVTTDIAQKPDSNWRFNTGDSYESLERAIIRTYLKLMGNKQKFLSGTLNMLVQVPSPFMYISLRSELFYLTTMDWDLYKATCNFTAVKIPTSTPTITVNLTGPSEDFYADTFVFYEDVLLSTGGSSITIRQLEFVDVTVDFVNIDAIPFTDSFLADFAASDTVEGVKTKWQVYKNGVKQRYVDWGTGPTLLPHEWTFDIAGNNIEFGYDLDSDLVEVIYYQI